MNYNHDKLFNDSVGLLKSLVSIPSVSFKEDIASDFLFAYLCSHKVEAKRIGNNIIATNKCFDPEKQTILLNSHIDTVKPNQGYSRNPYLPEIINGKLYGIGSNDAGGALATMLHAFLFFHEMENLDYNLAFIASAEEETGTEGGLARALAEIDFAIDYAIVGEPTGMDMAIAEKGLLVLDCKAFGQSGHAARDEGVNAIYKAMKDIEWFRNYSFEKVSDLLGPVKMTVTSVSAGYQHNVVPDLCTFCVDIRLNEFYSHQDVIDIISENVSSEIKPRSLRYKPSFIPADNFLVKAGSQLGLKTFGSPTCSDQIHMNFPSFKLGPGDSSRSHTADEFIFIDEISHGLDIYIKLLNKILGEK